MNNMFYVTETKESRPVKSASFDFEIIPSIWKHKIDKDGKVYVSDRTLTQTSNIALNMFLIKNNYFLKPAKEGAWIMPEM